MVRTGPCLVIFLTPALMLASLLGGCVEPLPKEVMIEDRFSADEERMIVAAIDEWNRIGLEYLGLEKILIYQGRYRDPDGFDELDLDDGRSVIYRGQDDRYYRFLSDHNEAGRTLLGYGTTADVLLFTFTLDTPEEFQHVALHELGHFLGLGHVPDDKNAVMYELTFDNPPLRLTRTDIQDFCLVFDCIKQP
jgi:hypothetical protein